MSSFRFKQFTIEQNNSSMRVNTDGVLLGSWMTIPKLAEENNNSYKSESKEIVGRCFRFLDIGTGTGVIALMAAQRVSEALEEGAKVEIDALEIEEGAFGDAKANFANSTWGNTANLQDITLTAYLSSLQEFSPIGLNSCSIAVDNRYDLIFSNPPYFIESLKSSDSAKCNARHTDTLSQSDLIKHALRVIKLKGVFALVLPVVEGEAFISKINFIRDSVLNSGRVDEIIFILHRICYIKTTEKKAPKRVLIELVADIASSCISLLREELVISSNSAYSEQYKSLTNEFYLNF